MRLLVVVQEHAADKYEQCMNTDEDVSKSEVLVKVLAPVLGSEAKVQEFLAMSVQKENKQKLIDNTNEAVAAGAFGAPSFVVRKAGADQDDFALFFGGDRLELLAAYLGVPYPGFAAKL
ncbi:hypothetical protein BGZ98_007548 [Dissophora globulifera]|nr:hypothetical protein BGZ98_007548 [Dissophora globulifera]